MPKCRPMFRVPFGVPRLAEVCASLMSSFARGPDRIGLVAGAAPCPQATPHVSVSMERIAKAFLTMEFLYRLRSCGSRCTRSQSPSMLADSTSIVIQMPGKTSSHHRPSSNDSRSWAIRRPHDGSGGGTPTPRKLSDASHGAEGAGEERAGQRDDQGDAGAVHEPAEHVAAEEVGAERSVEPSARRPEGRRVVDVGTVARAEFRHALFARRLHRVELAV